jgi:hypothetical protein
MADFRPLPLAAALACALATPTFAESEPGRLIAALSGDWNGDEEPDAILLIQGMEGQAEIQIFEGEFDGLQPLFTVPGAVYAGSWSGQSPGLNPLTDNSFSITTEQIGIGRTPWMAQVTVAYRDGIYMVAGYTYDFYDRIDPAHTGSCEVNLLTGDYVVDVQRSDGTPNTSIQARSQRTAFPLTELIEGFTPAECRGLFR